jgi:hypothetical protein
MKPKAPMKSSFKWSKLVVCALALPGCYTTTVSSGKPAARASVAYDEKWHSGVVYGIAELSGPYDLEAICPQTPSPPASTIPRTSPCAARCLARPSPRNPPRRSPRLRRASRPHLRPPRAMPSRHRRRPSSRRAQLFQLVD